MGISLSLHTQLVWLNFIIPMLTYIIKGIEPPRMALLCFIESIVATGISLMLKLHNRKDRFYEQDSTDEDKANWAEEKAAPTAPVNTDIRLRNIHSRMILTSAWVAFIAGIFITLTSNIQ